MKEFPLCYSEASKTREEGVFVDFKSSGFLYALGGLVVLFVILESVFFMVRAWKHGKEIGLSTEKMRGAITQSGLFSIAPAISIVATVLTLSGALGLVLPWIRLSVIGSITYEVPAAESALEALGYSGGLATEVTSKMGFSTVAWVMTVGSLTPLVLIPFLLKRIHLSVGKVAQKNRGWANLMASAAFIGLICAFVSRAIVGQGDSAILGDGAGILSISALLVSLLVMFLLTKWNSRKHYAWLDSMAMPISMFVSLGVIMLLAQVLPPDLTWLEFRG